MEVYGDDDARHKETNLIENTFAEQDKTLVMADTLVDETQLKPLNKAVQVVEPRSEDPGILAGKTFSVTSGTLEKGILLNWRGQKELGMIAKNLNQDL